MCGIQKKIFSPVNKVFSEDLKEEDFYPELLESGRSRKIQYLLPVSFNLGAFVFDSENLEYVNESNAITTNQIKEYSKNELENNLELYKEKMTKYTYTFEKENDKYLLVSYKYKR